MPRTGPVQPLSTELVSGPVLIKTAEQPPQIEELESLLERDDIALEKRLWIAHELRTAHRGYRGEKQAEYKLEFQFKARTDVATIHGLRIEHAGRTAQIDHLVISRYLDIWICESKSFTGRVDINDHAEWQVIYPARSYGIESPVSQARNHQQVLAEVLQRGLATISASATRDQLRFHLAVLFSDRARIDRPKPTTDLLRTELQPVVKIERFYAMFEELERERTESHAVPFEKLVEFATAIAKLHRAGSVDWAARFGLPRPPVSHATQLKLPLNHDQPKNPRPTELVDLVTATCAQCSRRLGTGEVQFCKDKSQVFDGRLYCFQCQRAARAATS